MMASASSSKYESAPIFPLSQQPYTLVELPCRVRNPDRAIAMVGGLSAIEKVVNNEHKFLELRFRGSMSHPAHGDKQSTNHLLLRIRRHKKHRRDFKFEVMGKIVNCVGFQGMVDFQFIQDDIFDASRTSLESPSASPSLSAARTAVDIQTRLISIDQEEDEAAKKRLQSSSTFSSIPKETQVDGDTAETASPDKLSKSKRGIRVSGKTLIAPTPSTDFEKLTEKELEVQLQSALSKQEKLNLTPPIFSRFDMPMDYEFRANPLSTMVSVTRDDGTTIFKRQLKRYGTRRPQVCQISFSDPVPTAPDPNLEPAQFQEDEDRQTLMNAVRDLFNRRPIWSRRALEAQFESKKMKSHIKLVLPHIAFYYKDGPWRKLWVRYGIHPRTDKSTGVYQMLDFRVPAEFRSQVLQRRKEKGLMTESEEYGGVDLLRRAPKRRHAVHEDLRSIMFSTDPQPGKASSSSSSSSTQQSQTQNQTQQQQHSQHEMGDHNEQEDEEEAPSKTPSSGQESHLFTSIPGQKSTVYQLCDIRLRAVQEIIKVEDTRKQIEIDDAEFNDEKQKMKRKNNDQYKFGTRMIKLRNAVCHEKYGWYTLDALEQIRFLMKKKIEQWIANGNEEDDEDIIGVSDEEEEEDFEDDFESSRTTTTTRGSTTIGSISSSISSSGSHSSKRPTRQDEEEEMDDGEEDEAIESSNLLLTDEYH